MIVLKPDPHPRVADVLDLVRILRRIMDPIGGEVAAVIAQLIHAVRMDSSGQYGNAYFRCRDDECGQAHDCTREDEVEISYILAGGAECHECGLTFVVEDLRISEGWVDRITEAANER